MTAVIVFSEEVNTGTCGEINSKVKLTFCKEYLQGLGIQGHD